MSEIGMVIARMREIVAQAQQAQQYLRQIEGDVDGRVRQLEGSWQGESVVAYLDRWSRAKTEMDEAVFTVDEIRILLDQAINDLIQADKRGAAASQ
jgi:WXG100 family type VII secretion target